MKLETSGRFCLRQTGWRWGGVFLPVWLLVAGLVAPAARGNVIINNLVLFNGANGIEPQAELTPDGHGNLYGTTFGTIFKVNTNGTLTTLHAAGETGNDTFYCGLAQGTDGNFYGAYADSRVFVITPGGTLTLLYTLYSITNQHAPFGNTLTLGRDGSFYGTYYQGGTNSLGAVFKITTNGGFTLLHSFTGGSDGQNPAGGLTLDPSGNFYGTTGGTIFRITTNGALTTLYTFAGYDGILANGKLALSTDGNLYGTAFYSGTNGYGTVFKLATNGVFTTLFSFSGTNGAYPIGGPMLGSDGYLYGLTKQGGAFDCGTIFRVSTNGMFRLLATFNRTNGALPFGSDRLVQESDGKIYGTTSGTTLLGSGYTNLGTVFWFLPPPTTNGVANNDAYGVNENTPLNISAPGVLTNDFGPNGYPISAVLVSSPGHGTLTLNSDGSFSYTPTNHFYGNDSFTYAADDDFSNSAPATVSLTVNHVAPVASNDTYSVTENAALNVGAPGVLANDTAGSSPILSAALVTGAAHGALTFNSDGSFNYVPNTNYYGVDSFTYQASDGVSNSSPATVSLTVNPLPPVATNDAYSVNEYAVLNVAAPGVLANDSDPNGLALAAVLVGGPGHGTLTLTNNGGFTYTPNAYFHGADSFTYRDNDGVANSSPATVSLTVNFVYQPPVATNDSYSVNENSSLNVSAPGVLTNDFDPNGFSLQAFLASGPGHGSVTLNSDGSFNYLPGTNYFGGDSFTYQAGDGVSNSAPATVSLVIKHAAPVASNDTYSATENIALNIGAPGVLANDTSSDGRSLTAVLVAGPAHGALTLNSDGSFNYLPNTNYFGGDSFTYKDSDGVSNSAPATVSLTVNRVYYPPTANDDVYSVNQNSNLTVNAPGVLVNDSDPNGLSLSASLVSGPSHGTLTLTNNGGFTYKPYQSFYGKDSFSYQATDGQASSTNATVKIAVNYTGPLFRTLVAFTGTGGNYPGQTPAAGLALGNDGNFYGVTKYGGTNNFGTVFKLTPAGVFTTLRIFTFDFTNGYGPSGGLVPGNDGYFYGTTSGGGSSGSGTVFRITPDGALTTLASFSIGSGNAPSAALVLASDGAFYGTTQQGGGSNDGTIFKVTTNGVLTTLFSFSGTNGQNPQSALVQAGDGNFYGATRSGGTNGYGIVFKMTPAGTFTVLHEFNLNDGSGAQPGGGLVQGTNGVLYGTTGSGGITSIFGTLYKITTNGVFTTLVALNNNIGSFPDGNLLSGSDGNFYGTTTGGSTNGMGSIFRMTTAGALTALYAFTNTDGTHPLGGLVQGSDGNLYGVMQSGGAGYGTIFSFGVPAVPVPMLQGAVSAGGGAFNFTWNATPGQNYQVQYKTNLVQSAWLNLGGVMLATNGVISISDVTSQNPQNFYRVVLLP